MVMEVITITYQDDAVDAVSFDPDKGLGSFEYEPGFVKKKGLSCPRLKCHYRIAFIAFPSWVSIPLKDYQV